MFTVSEENTVNCLEGSLDIFGSVMVGPLRYILGNLRQSSGIVGSLQKFSEITRSCRKMPETSLIY